MLGRVENRESPGRKTKERHLEPRSAESYLLGKPFSDVTECRRGRAPSGVPPGTPSSNTPSGAFLAFSLCGHQGA
jgi:hypothetical protein